MGGDAAQTPLDWFAPFAAAYNAYLWNCENGFARDVLDEADWQLAVLEAQYYNNRAVVWTWRRMMARTRQVWPQKDV